MDMNFYQRFSGHLTTTLRHKWYVFQECCKAGIPFRGIMHDMSKLSPIEFWESVKYYQGDKSPIVASKAANGYSKAWQHHKGHNPHHYEYWIDNLDHGGTPVPMPFLCVLELVCDYLGACKAYEKGAFSYQKEYEWWLRKSSGQIAMHPATKQFVSQMLWRMTWDNSDRCLSKEYAYTVYTKCCDEFGVKAVWK